MLTQQLRSQAAACKDSRQKHPQCFRDLILLPRLKLQISLSVPGASSEVHPWKESCPALGLASTASGMAGGRPLEHTQPHVLECIWQVLSTAAQGRICFYWYCTGKTAGWNTVYFRNTHRVITKRFLKTHFNAWRGGKRASKLVSNFRGETLKYQIF